MGCGPAKNDFTMILAGFTVRAWGYWNTGVPELFVLSASSHYATSTEDKLVYCLVLRLTLTCYHPCGRQCNQLICLEHNWLQCVRGRFNTVTLLNSLVACGLFLNSLIVNFVYGFILNRESRSSLILEYILEYTIVQWSIPSSVCMKCTFNNFFNHHHG